MRRSAGLLDYLAFLAAAFLTAFLAAFFAAGFFAAPVLRAVAVLAFAVVFFTAFLAAAFLAGFFFAAAFFIAISRLSSSSVGSGCPVKACRNASHSRLLLVAWRRLATWRRVRSSESSRRMCSGIDTVIFLTADDFRPCSI